MQEDRRKDDRVATAGQVHLQVGGMSHIAFMRNLSQAGCMVECAQLPADIGARCEVSLMPGLQTSGRIAWMLGDAVGISFILPIPSAVVNDFSLDDWPLRANRKRISG